MAKARQVEGLDCGARVLDGARLVLRTRLQEMCDYRAAALDFSDIEGVHAMRVASRRLRSAMRDFEPYLNERPARRRVKRVADALGAVRDEDVAIEALSRLAEEARELADEETARGVRALVAEREQRREAARAELAREISEEAVGELRERFLARLAGATRPPAPPADLTDSVPPPVSVAAVEVGDGDRAYVGLTFLRAGRDILLARSAELRELSGSLYRPFDIEPLHRMRIAAKRLRYAVELYGQCFGERLRPYARKIAGLQKSLGEVHDCDVWVEDLGARLADAQRSARDGLDGHDDGRRTAAVWLMQHFVRERTRHYTDALACWQDCESGHFFARLLATFDESPGDAGEPPSAAAEVPAASEQPAARPPS